MTIYRFSSIVKPISLTRSPKTGDMKRIDQRDINGDPAAPPRRTDPRFCLGLFKKGGGCFGCDAIV